MCKKEYVENSCSKHQSLWYLSLVSLIIFHCFFLWTFLILCWFHYTICYNFKTFLLIFIFLSDSLFWVHDIFLIYLKKVVCFVKFFNRNIIDVEERNKVPTSNTNNVWKCFQVLPNNILFLIVIIDYCLYFFMFFVLIFFSFLSFLFFFRGYFIIFSSTREE